MKETEGFIKCPRCNGYGGYYCTTKNDDDIERGFDTKQPLQYQCWKCDGTGKITWLESIFPKKSSFKVPIPQTRIITIDDYERKRNEFGKNNVSNT